MSISTRATDDPFATRPDSLAIEAESDTTSLRNRHNVQFGASQRLPQEKLVSYRLVGEYPRPWLNDKRNGRVSRGNLIIWIMIVLGIGLSGFICYDGYKSVKNHDYCLVLEDNFDTLNTDVWGHEVQLDGFGTGSFDWATNNDKVTFTDSEGLHIIPQLTVEATDITSAQIVNGYKLNLTKAGGDGSCTNAQQDYTKCSIASNSTAGTIINPVMSARLSTKGKKMIRYGKVEVTAKFPKGDWLWPAIWMMPEKDMYGEWPRSGEIDIAEARGNGYSYPGGRDVYTSALHWGPAPQQDQYWRTIYGRKLRRSDFSSRFHTFGLEWSGDYLFTYIDSRLQQVLQVYFKDQTMWERGHLAQATTKNDTFYVDPWSSTGRLNTPFDQDFYLILNVAVGSRNGWFLDGVGGKPWVDASSTAPLDFWKAKDKWYPTWGQGTERGMTVRSVKMWQEGACGTT